MEVHEMKTEPCPECREMTIVTLAEPEGRPIRLNVGALRFFRLVPVSASNAFAVPTDVHESHVATCKAINRKTE